MFVHLIGGKGSLVFWVNSYTGLWLCFLFVKWEKEMEPNGEASLKTPLLQHLESATSKVPQSSARGDKDSRKIMFKIGGINCASCAVSLESMVAGMEGVESIAVSPIQGQAVVLYRPEVINVSQLKLSSSCWIYLNPSRSSFPPFRLDRRAFHSR